MESGAPQCVSVRLREGERAIRLLRSLGLLAAGFKPTRQGGRLLLPVVDVTRAAKALEGYGLYAEPCSAVFKERRRPRSVRELVAGISGYWQVGDIVVFNRREGGPSVDEYRRAAETLLAEHSRVRAVFLKEATWGEHRVQKLVHLAGERRTRTVHKEYGLEFEVDIARAYFNPRLGGEHRAVAELVAETGASRVLDMFSGVGGFSIHVASLTRARVVAVDINPFASSLAARNVARNMRRLKGEVAVLRANAARLPEVLEPVFDFIIMNHPTASKNYSWVACSLASGPARVIYYTLTTSCKDAVEEAQEAFSKPCCGGVETGWCREVLDYSPSLAVYRVEVGIGRGEPMRASSWRV